MHQIPKFKWFLSLLAIVCAQSIEAGCKFGNEDVVGAAPTGDAPTTSECTAILLPIRVRLILDIWGIKCLEKPFCSDSPLQDCGAVILTNVSGIIQSPDFLNHHPSTTFCTWTIQVNVTVVGWQLKSSRCWANVLNFMISQDMLLYGLCMTVPHKWTKMFWLTTAN